MNRLNIPIAIICLWVLPLSIAFAEMREWTSADGRKLKAEFIGTLGAGNTTKVKLKLGDGSEIVYPIGKLSEADRIFVKSSLPTDPAALAGEVDKLVIAKMHQAYLGLKKDLSDLARNPDLSATDKAKRREEIEREIAMCIPNKKTNSEQFMRRIYLDIIGRIPTYAEADRYLSSGSRNKRAELIDELLDTQGYSMRMFNYFSDLLRVRETVVKMGGRGIKADPYIEWLKQNIKDDKPFDKMVHAMLTADGHLWEDPATGYMITDTGMKLCNLSNTFTVFMGTEITCAQCHDHPFEQVKQIDFYRMASFVESTITEDRSGRTVTEATNVNRERNYLRSELERMSKVLDAAGKLSKNRDTDGEINNIFSGYRPFVHDSRHRGIKLPHDYNYDNGEPHMVVSPSAYFGDTVNLDNYKHPRDAFADWVTSRSNPRFTINLVNRLWKLAFGLGQIEPIHNIPGHLDGQAQNYELLTFLESMIQDMDYSIKDFFRVIYNTETYQREAETLTPTLTQIDKGSYHFPGPILRRMSAEQMWDSLVTLTSDNPEKFKRKGWEEYKNLMTTDLTSLKTANEIEDFKNRFRSIGKVDTTSDDSPRGAKIGGEQMVRASELPQPMRPGHFLRIFGQSDKQMIENQYTSGSAPQVMAMLNGTVTNKVLTDKDAYLIKEIAYGTGKRGDKVDKIFLSILGRMPTSDEKRKAQSGLRSRKDKSETEPVAEAELERRAIGDVIWALVNTREFMFIQ